MGSSITRASLKKGRCKEEWDRWRAGDIEVALAFGRALPLTPPAGKARRGKKGKRELPPKVI